MNATKPMLRKSSPRNALLMTVLLTSIFAATPTASAQEPETFVIQAPYDEAQGSAIAATGTIVAAAATVCRYPDYWCEARGSAAIVALKALEGPASEIQVSAALSVGPAVCGAYSCSAWAFLEVSHDQCPQCHGSAVAYLPTGGGDVTVSATVANVAGGPIPEGTLRITGGISVSALVDNYWEPEPCTGAWGPILSIIGSLSCVLLENTAGSATASAELQRIEGTISSAAAVRSLEINPPTQRTDIAKGETAVYNLTVTNKGTGRETITLTTSGERSGWAVSLSATTVVLQPGQSEVVQLSVSGSKTGTLTVNVTADASGDGSVSASATATTTVKK